MSYLNLFIVVLIALAFSSTTSAGTTNVEGGPRTVIQAMTTVIIEQPTSTNLHTKIVNASGNAVIELETEEASTVISVAGLAEGTYTVETIDDNGDYQEFNITVE
ncbi:MAG: Unknown protein [uncultured Aureispira sp.]|uniref:Secretion system C-terminal sorting domain-containing protein n=1 Tax=uncultured Aureispira sp. TaxID=1331704 RepID=A0A6S6SFF2_9BACT|nr:MAG: Unknown protein [uncultured Aureispira sp.]